MALARAAFHFTPEGIGADAQIFSGAAAIVRAFFQFGADDFLLQVFQAFFEAPLSVRAARRGREACCCPGRSGRRDGGGQAPLGDAQVVEQLF